MPRKYTKPKARSTYRTAHNTKFTRHLKYALTGPTGRLRSHSNMLTNIKTSYLLSGVNGLFPDRMIIKMKNEYNINFTGTAGATNAFFALGNGLHLPLSTVLSGAVAPSVGIATAIQGLGNILATDIAFASTGPYEYYRIHSSAVKLRVQSTATTINNSATLQIIPVDGNTIGALGNINTYTVSEIAEMPYNKLTTVSGQTTNTGVKIKHAMSTARMYALKYKSNLENVEFSGYQGSNPASVWYWMYMWSPQTASNTPATIIVIQEYFVEFYNRNTLASTSG